MKVISAFALAWAILAAAQHAARVSPLTLDVVEAKTRP